MKKYVELNTNSHVKVKLTEIGLARHRELYDERAAAYRKAGRLPPEYVPPSVDENGYHKSSLWELMQTYGDLFIMGRPTPWDTGMLVPVHEDDEPEPAAPTSTPKRVLKL